MKNLKVVEVGQGSITFDNGVVLESYHSQSCCEDHWISFSDLTIDDFKGLEFDLTNDNFFKRIEDYGIELVATNGQTVKVPGYGSNNGYYSSNLDLVVNGDGINKTYDISTCQDWAES